MEITIRLAEPDDINTLAALGTTTCYEAYFELDRTRDLADYCARVYSPTNVKVEIEDPDSTFLIADCDSHVGGFAKLRENNKVECVGDANAIELQRIYVLAQLKGRGVGRALHSACVKIAHERGFKQLWLGVWDKNIAAQQFYECIGMKYIGSTDFSDGNNDFLNFVYVIDL